MRFYTNVVQWGNQLLVREINNGERRDFRLKYEPTLYAKVQERTPYKTLKGDFCTPIKHTSIKSAKEWVGQYKNQPDLIFGNTQ